MLTLKQITEEYDRVVSGLEKKNFKGAKEAVDKAIAIDKVRRDAQTQLDATLAESKKYAYADLNSLNPRRAEPGKAAAQAEINRKIPTG